MIDIYQDELYHHGILGQKWGVRRYQNPDGTLTEEGKRYYSRNKKDIIKGNKIINNHAFSGHSNRYKAPYLGIVARSMAKGELLNLALTPARKAIAKQAVNGVLNIGLSAIGGPSVAIGANAINGLINAAMIGGISYKAIKAASYVHKAKKWNKGTTGKVYQRPHDI